MTQYEIVVVGRGVDAIFCRDYLNTWYLHESWSTDRNGRFRTKLEALKCLENLYTVLHSVWEDEDFGNFDAEPLMGEGCMSAFGVLLFVRLIDPRRNGK